MITEEFFPGDIVQDYKGIYKVIEVLETYPSKPHNNVYKVEILSYKGSDPTNGEHLETSKPPVNKYGKHLSKFTGKLPKYTFGEWLKFSTPHGYERGKVRYIYLEDNRYYYWISPSIEVGLKGFWLDESYFSKV